MRMELHPSLASVLVDFQGNYVNGNPPFVPIVLQERCASPLHKHPSGKTFKRCAMLKALCELNLFGHAFIHA